MKRLDFHSDNFNTSEVTKQICASANTELIEKQRDGFIKYINNVNSTIVSILTKDTSLFVDLSQCISSFEREFVNFPREIKNIKKIVNEAQKFPSPKFSEVPHQLTVDQFEILDQPATLVDAPLIYDFLIQQHRINESIELVTRCIKMTYMPSYNPIKYVEDWITQSKKDIYKEIQGRLKTMQLYTEEAQLELTQLVNLGYENESIQTYFRLASQALDEKLNSIQHTGRLLQYIRDSSETLSKEIVEKVRIFRNLYPEDSRLAQLVFWVNCIVESKLPITHPEHFYGNFGLVNEAVTIMQNALAPIENVGISLFSTFDQIPKYYLELLKFSAKHHQNDISDALNDDDWDIDMEGIREAKLMDFPLSTSFEHFRSHAIQFVKEIEAIYTSELFSNSSILLNDILLSYFTGCIRILKGKVPVIDRFCAILIQMQCIYELMLPELLKEFTRITNFAFPIENALREEAQKSMNIVIQMLVQTFIKMWSDVLPPDEIEWGSVKEVDSTFEGAIEVMTQFLNMLNLPENKYKDTCDVLADSLLDVVEATGEKITSVKLLNSFDFNWEFFSKSLEKLLPRPAMEKIKAGIQTYSNQICTFRGFADSDRMTFKEITSAVSKCMKKKE